MSMDNVAFSFIVLGGAYVAGFLGSLTGLGGGVVLTPLLTLFFHVDIKYAIGSSLVASIATSSGSAVAYVKEGITNIKLGMFLEIATTIGAVLGAFLAAFISPHYIAVVFGLVLIFSAVISLRPHPVNDNENAASSSTSGLARKLDLNSTYPQGGKQISYNVHHVMGGFSLMGVAGMLSGLLGIGSGALKVLALDTVMKVPFKVSTTTSNFMIGVTAAASAVLYFQRGYIDPGLCMPVVLGVMTGALTGSRILITTGGNWIKILFTFLISLIALEMIYNGLTHKI